MNNPKTFDLIALCLFALLCTACTSTVKRADTGFIKDIQRKIPVATNQKGADYHISAGLEALSAGKVEAASEQFNRGLKYEPKNANLHFLNALIYHQRADAGDLTQFELAEVGYQLALKFEANHWMAAYQLGKLYLQQRRFRNAQNEFARGLLIEPNNPSLSYGLVAASYAAGDVETASMAQKTLGGPYQGHPSVLRAKAMISAALNDSNAAAEFYQRYCASGTEAWRAKQVSRRLDSWGAFHQRTNQQLAQAEVWSSNKVEEGSRQGRAHYHEPLAPANEKMVILDAIILQQEKSTASSSGVNLLSGLSVMFSGNLLDYAKNRLNDVFIDNIPPADPEFEPNPNRDTQAKNEQRNKSLTMSLPAVTYSLNIANAQDGNNKLLARPSVLAYEGNESELFIGTEITYTTPGNLGGGNSYDKEIGLQLRVTPELIDGENIKMSVYVEFDSVVPTSIPGTFTQSIATAKARTHVVSEPQFGQTLMIGAGTSKQTSKSSNGVPWLKEIPILKKLFNVDSESDRETSLIVLITPRKPVRLNKRSDELDNLLSERERDVYAGTPELKALRKRYKSWWQPAPNTLKALESLSSDSELLKEFRSGDIKFIDLDEDLSTSGNSGSQVPEGIIRQLVDNMYF